MKCLSGATPAQGRTSSWARVPVAAVLVAASAGAWAQALISPVLVEFRPGQKVATVRIALSDRAQFPMRLQAQLLRWRQDAHGAAITQASDDLIVAPRIAELKPGQQQVLRVGLRGSPGTNEAAYRLVLEDAAEHPASDVGGASVNFRMAYDLPVIVAARGAPITQLRWKNCSAETASKTADALCVRIVNAGNHYVKVQSLLVRGDGWEQTLTPKEAASVLAGDEREWTQPARVTGAVRAVQVRTALGQVLDAQADGG